MANFQHDCDLCTALGEFSLGETGQKYDLYFCNVIPEMPTVIARYGEYGDYISGMVFADKVAPLAVAAVRAVASGLLSPDILAQEIRQTW